MTDANEVWESLMDYDVIDNDSMANERELRKQINKNDKWGKISEKLIKQLLMSDKFTAPFKEAEKIKDEKEQRDFIKEQKEITNKYDFYVSVWNIRGKLLKRLRSKKTGRFVKTPNELK